MSSILLPIFKRKLYSLLRKWKGVVKQHNPVDVPNLLMLLQIIGFKMPSRFETENTISIQVHCNHHPNRVYTLEMPVKPGLCSCQKTAEQELSSPSTSGVWRTRQVFPLRQIKPDIEEYARIILVTIVELIVRVTHSREEVYKLLGKHVDVGLIVDCVREEERSSRASAEITKPLTEEFSNETLTQMAQNLKHAMCFIDMTLAEIPEHLRNTDKTVKQVLRKKGSFHLRRSPRVETSPSSPSERTSAFSLSTSGSDNAEDEPEPEPEVIARKKMGEIFSTLKRRFKSA